MPGKCRPSLRRKVLKNVERSNLSNTDKKCIKAVFEKFEQEQTLQEQTLRRPIGFILE